MTENEEFLDELTAQVEWGSPLILYDDVGGVIGEPGWILRTARRHRR